MTGDNKNNGDMSFWGWLKSLGPPGLIIIVIAVIVMWIVAHNLTQEGGQVVVCWGLVEYTKGKCQKIEGSGYVPLAAMASQKDEAPSPGDTVSVREDGALIRTLPNLESPGTFLPARTEAVVLSQEGTWLRIMVTSK